VVPNSSTGGTTTRNHFGRRQSLERLNAANAIGDDRQQMNHQGHVVPDAFTHSTSAQRMYWFRKGFETGDINAGNAFEAIE